MQQLEKKYRDQVNFAWIDTSLYSETEYDQLKKISQDMKVQIPPALVLLDGEGNVLHRWLGELNSQEVSKAIEQVISKRLI
ncbi:TlpA family protein disulfide reductase [Desulforamulus aquiferis]|uniref:Thioredoxin-like fold domain-containing protein n=1 Tax=Desulforamulus aquiferis TaxID=1397668 RepID=A0AAW7ZDW1_9FIRM|nr:hypothetical protein [Desulforamulus aquiferis]MDO7787557.1 hypothetical protein [Desulforamulus aquiferis]